MAALLDRTVAVERHALSRGLGEGMGTLGRRAELGFGAFDAMMQRSLPCKRALLLHEALVGSRRRSWDRSGNLNCGSRVDIVDGRARRCRHSDAVGIVLEPTLDPVAGW